VEWAGGEAKQILFEKINETLTPYEKKIRRIKCLIGMKLKKFSKKEKKKQEI